LATYSGIAVERRLEDAEVAMSRVVVGVVER
jgi:hypothetical protein